MILVDPRRGSGELLSLLQAKVPAAIETLPAGDFAFEGNGPNGRMMIGVERKRLGDMLQSMVSGRFSGYQLVEMCDMYQVMFLLVEGLYRPDPDTGLLQELRRGSWVPAGHGTRKFMYKDLSHFLTTISVMTGVRVIRSSTYHETVQILADLFSWWNDKQFKEHRSHLQMHNTRPPTLRKPPLRRCVANELPSVGWERSKAVMESFPSTFDMVNATVEQWMEVTGIGKGIAEKIYNAIRSE
jgi:ERCC4-type nuclease